MKVQKTAPRLTLGVWKLRYIQVPYHDRFFVIEFDNLEVMKIPFWLYQAHKCLVFPLGICIGLQNNPKKFLDFMERVKAHETYLDSEEDPETPE